MHGRFRIGGRVAIGFAVLTLTLLPSYSEIHGSRLQADQRSASYESGITDGQRDELPARALYARANYVWPYATGPHYGQVESRARRAPGVVHTNVGSFDVTRGEPDLPAPLRAPVKLATEPAQYFIVTLDPMAGAAGPELRKAIAAHGGAVMQALPVASWVARLTPDAMASIEGRPEVLAVAPYHPAFKLDPSIGRVPLNDPTRALSTIYDLDVRIFAGESADLVARTLTRLGGNVVSVFPDTIRVEIDRSRLAELASLEPVQWINEHLPIYPRAEETTTTVQTGRWNQGATPYHDAGIDGSGGGLAAGQVLMVLDSGIQLDAGDLSDTATSAGAAGPTHRKVLRYQSTGAFGGVGDTKGCDAPEQGGFTHGQLVSATALGNATAVDLSYGSPWFAYDDNQNPWKLDGVAPGAKLVAFDGQQTPPAVSCADPLQDTISPGNLYTSPSGGSLGDSYINQGARIFNFSWGADSNSYTTNAQDVDDFLFDNKNAMVFISAGNASDDANADGIPDSETLGTPATTKNGLAIGASRVGNDLGEGGQPRDRAAFSSVGPAASSFRVAPQLMAPGDENGGGDMGLASEYGCRSNDNDQSDPVECDTVSGVEGTSFASPAAAGAALLVRDYFAQGFYPDGTSANPGNAGDQVPDISGVLVKSVLIASAQFLDRANVTWPHRFNNEQGYGRIQLDRALPLENWPASSTGLVVADGGIPGGVGNLAGLDGVIDVTLGETDVSTFEVCDKDQELRVALSWIEASGASLVNDLNLVLQSPSGKLYWGNYFTDDNNRNRVLDAGEDCPGIDGVFNELDAAPWSMPTNGCINAVRDNDNPTEAIMLSPDYDGDGGFDLDPDDDNQLELGTWSISVESALNAVGDTAQRYAVAIAGGVCLGSSVRFDNGVYACNNLGRITINEIDEPSDAGAGLTVGEVAGRLTVEVVALDVCDDGTTPCASPAECTGIGGGACNASLIVDSESGTDLGFAQPDAPALNFVAESVVLTDGTAQEPGNGALDVRSGNRIRAIYADESAGSPDPDKQRRTEASIDCNVRVAFGDVVFQQFGQDTGYFVTGGCERNARGEFYFGFPDRYMDAEELISYNFAFASNEEEDMEHVEVNLRCVVADGDSPEACRPNTNGCVDPNRLNNTTCDGSVDGDPVYMTILDTPKVVGLIPANSALSSNFSIQMPASIPGTPEIEMILEVVSRTSGKTTSGMAVNRHKLDADENSVYYSTDFPTGGVEIRDRNNNEVPDDPTTNIGDFLEDYIFETRTWSDLTAGGTKNTLLQSPWDFDGNRGGFTSGLGALSDEATIGDVIAQWGEDKNFNDLHDGFCNVDTTVGCVTKNDCIFASAGTLCNTLEDRDPVNLELDYAWGSLGGCGWQSRASSDATGYVWHTGNIKGTTAGNCMFLANNPGQCQYFETVSGSSGLRLWFELLTTPVMQKVNGADYTIEITHWAWNQALDLPDSNVALTWEFDTDVTQLEPVDLKADLALLNFGFGPYGPVINANNPDLTNGFSVFAPVEGVCNVGGGLCADNTDCTLTCSSSATPCELDSHCTGPSNFCDNCTIPADANGSAGNNRQAQNSCWFRGTNGIAPASMATLGVPGPPDDDIDNDSDGTIDEYVTLNGPVRNMDLYAFNGLDMRFDTLEDIFGDTGEFFQAGIGIVNFEKNDPELPDPATGYGIGVDDVVVEWREFNLIDDATACGGNGECAVINLQTTNFFEGNALMTVTVLEKSPPADNDCDFDDLPDGTIDCDSDGVRDLPVKATTEAEVAGEIVFANLVPGTIGEYKAELPVSALSNVEGVLFAQPMGTDQPTVTVLYLDLDDGTGQKCMNDVDPSVQGRVESGTTLILTRASVVVTNIVLSDNGDDDGWADTNETVQMQIVVGNKTGVDLTGVTARLMTDDPKIDCVLNGAIFVGDVPAGGSVLSAEPFEFRVGDVQREGTCSVGANSCTSDAQCTAGGSDACDADLVDFSAELNINLAANEFDTTLAPQSVTLDLDLDAVGGSGPGAYHEGFESGTFGTFTSMNLDAGRNSETASEGYRCQYSDPDWPQSNSYNQIGDCWLGATATQADAFHWQVSDGNAGTPPIGRSFDGRYSVYMGVWDISSSAWTVPMATLDALATSDPINIGWDRVCETTRTQACVTDEDCSGETCVGVTPELSIKHQISLPDSRATPSAVGEAGDGAAVGVQLAAPDGSGTPVGHWIKLEPYLNVYDSQRSDNFANCFFDPVDDGNTEDDFFDPLDPERRLGPSTLCFPEMVFVHQGDTDSPFSADNIGLASDGPGLEGNTGEGTWVESRFNLQRFRGRRLRLRFISSGIKAGTAETQESLFGWNPTPVDDGWWVDDVQISDTLANYASINVDVKPNTGFPGCGTVCSSVTAALTADPPGGLTAPGQVVELSAVDTVADRCTDGTLQYRFWVDGDLNGTGGDAADTLLRSWTDNPVLVQAPVGTTGYVVDVRCSALTACDDSAPLTVHVTCPEAGLYQRQLGVFGFDFHAYPGTCSGDAGYPCSQDADCAAHGGTCSITPGDSNLYLSWEEPGGGRVVRLTRVTGGDGASLSQPPAYGTLFDHERQLTTGFVFADNPGAGEFFWYLVTHDDDRCNVGGSWQTSPGSEPARDGSLP